MSTCASPFRSRILYGPDKRSTRPAPTPERVFQRSCRADQGAESPGGLPGLRLALPVGLPGHPQASCGRMGDAKRRGGTPQSCHLLPCHGAVVRRSALGLDVLKGLTSPVEHLRPVGVALRPAHRDIHVFRVELDDRWQPKRVTSCAPRYPHVAGQGCRRAKSDPSPAPMTAAARCKAHAAARALGACCPFRRSGHGA